MYHFEIFRNVDRSPIFHLPLEHNEEFGHFTDGHSILSTAKYRSAYLNFLDRTEQGGSGLSVVVRECV